MHLGRIEWLSVAVVLLLVLVARGVEGQDAPPANSKSARVRPADWVPVDPTPAADTNVIPGDGYTLEVKRGGAKKVYRGDVIQVNKKWVVLRSVTVRSENEGVPYLMDIPRIGKMFGHHREVSQEEELWIPRDAATVKARQPALTTWVVNRAVGSEPPAPAGCNLDKVAGDKVDRQHGELRSVGDRGVTLAAGKDNSNWQIDWADILCIAIEKPSTTPEQTAQRPTGQSPK